jgi:hypothetical protein
MKTAGKWKHETGAGYEKWTGYGHEIVLVKLTEEHHGKWRATDNGRAISETPFQTKGAALTGIRRVLLRAEREAATAQAA